MSRLGTHGSELGVTTPNLRSVTRALGPVTLQVAALTTCPFNVLLYQPGDLLVACFSGFSTGGQYVCTGVVDNLGATWTLIPGNTTSTSRTYIAYRLNAPAGITTATATTSSANGNYVTGSVTTITSNGTISFDKSVTLNGPQPLTLPSTTPAAASTIAFATATLPSGSVTTILTFPQPPFFPNAVNENDLNFEAHCSYHALNLPGTALTGVSFGNTGQISNVSALLVLFSVT